MGNQASDLLQLKQDINSIFPQVDKDADGHLNQEEFSGFLQSFLPLWGHIMVNEDKVKSLMALHDKDKDGKLSRADIENMLLPDGHENATFDPKNQVHQPIYNDITVISLLSPPLCLILWLKWIQFLECQIWEFGFLLICLIIASLLHLDSQARMM